MKITSTTPTNPRQTNPRLILQEKAQKNWSGCLLISEPQDKSVSWKIYLQEGKVEYATSAVGQRERLTCLWQQFQPNLTMPELTSEVSDYEDLCNWWMAKQLSLSELQQLIFQLTQEALVQILSFETILVKPFPNRRLAKPVISYSWLELAELKDEAIHKWRALRSSLDSNFSRLNLDSKHNYEFYKLWTNICKKKELITLFQSQKISVWLEALGKKLCLYELATEVAIDSLTIAENLLPLLEKNLIQVLPFHKFKPPSPSTITPAANNPSVVVIHHRQTIRQKPEVTTSADVRPLVVCIDDNKTVQRQVKMVLESVGYKVIGILDPRYALKTLKGEDPAMILMDINMPNIDGYELCTMLRRSHKFQQTPVVMLTGRDGMINRARAKFVGANHYLTKPCEPNNLIAIVQQLTVK